MAERRRVIPFDGGQEQGISKALLSGRFSLVRNGVLSRDGQLRPRPAFTQLAATAYGSGTMVAYDLVALNDRLLALGDTMSRGYPTDLFELVSGGAAAWRPTSPSPTVPRLPRVTGVRDLPQPPDQREGVASWGCAAVGGFTCLVWNNAEAVSSTTGFGLVQLAATGQTVTFDRFAASGTAASDLLRVVALSDRFIVVGANAAGTSLAGRSFTPASSESFASLGELTNDSSAYNVIAVARAEGADQFVTATAATASGTIRVRRWDNDGDNQVPSGGQYASITDGAGFIDRLEVHASDTDDAITVGAQTDGNLNLYTFELDSGDAVGSGPFVPFSGVVVEEFAFCSTSTANVIWVVATITGEDEPEVRMRTYNTSTNALGTVYTLKNVRLASTPLEDGNEVVFAVRCGPDADSQSNMLIAVKPDTARATTPLAAKDFEISTAESLHIPNLVKVSGALYWANASLSADGQASPRVTVCDIGAASRRHVAQVGATLVIGGGVPVKFDGMALYELGFLNRPLIVSVASESGGSLTSGATYTYIAIWEALDSDDNVIRSAVSAHKEHDTDNTANSVIVDSPLSMRVNAGAVAIGSTVRLKLYRNVVITTTEAATVTGTKIVDPPEFSLDGLSIGIYVTDSEGSDRLNITFTSAATTPTAIASEINAVTTDRVTASVDGGRIKLTTVEEGEDVSLGFTAAGATTTLGFTPGRLVAEGTTVHEPGDVFHLCATEYTSLSGEVGEHIELTDTISDEDLREEQVLYTQAGSPLDSHSPYSADLVASGGENVVVAGLPRRDQWKQSKPFASARGVEFANPGREKFSRRIRGDIEAITKRDTQTVIWTRREIWALDGQGPDRNGQGDFQAQRLIYGQGGMRAGGRHSLVETDEGTLFQLDDNKIYMLSAGGQLQWIGHPVIDTLELYPVITAACYVRALHMVAFACQNTAGSSGVVIRYDLRRKQWFEDDVGAVDAMAEHGGRLCLVIGGAVYQQDAGFASGTVPTLTVQLGSFLNFGTGGWGAITAMVLLAQYRGPCTIKVEISYDDTATWNTIRTATLTDTDFSTGDSVSLVFTPATQECARFALQVTVDPTGDDSGGAWLLALEVYDDPDAGPMRVGEKYDG